MSQQQVDEGEERVLRRVHLPGMRRLPVTVTSLMRRLPVTVTSLMRGLPVTVTSLISCKNPAEKEQTNMFRG